MHIQFDVSLRLHGRVHHWIEEFSLSSFCVSTALRHHTHRLCLNNDDLLPFAVYEI